MPFTPQRRRWDSSRSSSASLGKRSAKLRLKKRKRASSLVSSSETTTTVLGAEASAAAAAKKKGPVISEEEHESVSKCTVCWEDLGGAIYQCPEGHLLCPSCSGNAKLVKCGICRSPVHPSNRIRARAVEELLASVEMACRWGCGFRGKKSARSAHESACLAAPAACAFCSFAYRGDEASILEHVRSAHAALDLTSSDKAKRAVTLKNSEYDDDGEEKKNQRRPSSLWCLAAVSSRDVFALFVRRDADQCHVECRRLPLNSEGGGQGEDTRRGGYVKVRLRLPEQQWISFKLLPSDASPTWDLARLRKEFRNIAGKRTIAFPSALLERRDELKLDVSTGSSESGRPDDWAHVPPPTFSRPRPLTRADPTNTVRIRDTVRVDDDHDDDQGASHGTTPGVYPGENDRIDEEDHDDDDAEEDHEEIASDLVYYNNMFGPHSYRYHMGRMDYM